MPDGLDTGNHARVHAQSDGRDTIDREQAATNNVHDMRRARQRARRVMRELEDELIQFLEEQGVPLQGRGDADEKRLNEAISRLAAVKLSSDLHNWLTNRRQQTMARAVRAARDNLQRELDEEFRGPDFGPGEQALNREISAIDAGLLYDADDSLAEEIGNDVTRQIRLGVQNNEQVRSPDPDELDIGERVAMTLTDADNPKRDSAGISGQTKRTKAELISHDSIQQGYNDAATKRYLNNGFRFVVYDAVCDYVTSDLCRRLGECDGDPVVIDLTETPWLVPPNHPWCRSGIRPTLNTEERDAVTEDDIADGYLNTVFSTEQYRPTALDVGRELSPTALQRSNTGLVGGE
jgi:hypothetical protein